MAKLKTMILYLRHYKGHLYLNSWKVNTNGKKIKSFNIGFYDPRLKSNIKDVKVVM
jgi:hypothetical protein